MGQAGKCCRAAAQRRAARSAGRPGASELLVKRLAPAETPETSAPFVVLSTVETQETLAMSAQ
jgi:hypothetical protein